MIFYSPFCAFSIAIIWLGFFFECSNGTVNGNDKVPKNIGKSSSSRGRNIVNKTGGDSAEVPLKFIQNKWDDEFCHEKLKVKDLEGGKQKPTISVLKTTISPSAGYSAFAKYPISLNNDLTGIFYFEIKVKKMGSSFFFGFADKQKDKLEKMNYMEKHTYAYTNGGSFVFNGSEKGVKQDSKEGDVVGIGVNLDTRKIIFNKNGNKFDSSALFLDKSSDVRQLFPFVILSKVGDKIETNFGPHFNYEMPIREFSIQTADNFLRGGEITKQENLWDATACHKNLEIIGDKNLTVKKTKEGSDWLSVFAKHPILPNNNSSNIFYFEITVKNLLGCILFGFADKQNKNALDKGPNFLKHSYIYHLDGYFYINENQPYVGYKCGVGDTVGIGVNLATRQIIFTKNGRPIDSNILSISSLLPPSAFEQLFPFVALFSIGDEITANFGAEEFKFNQKLSELRNIH